MTASCSTRRLMPATTRLRRFRNGPRKPTRRPMADMSWSPIPDDDWAPLEHERDKFFSVHIDETSQTKHRYLMIGGLAVPLSHTAQLETDIIAARAGTVVASTQPDG